MDLDFLAAFSDGFGGFEEDCEISGDSESLSEETCFSQPLFLMSENEHTFSSRLPLLMPFRLCTISRCHIDFRSEKNCDKDGSRSQEN